MEINEIISDQAGYLMAYLTNENQEAVNIHFDDFSVTHRKNHLIQAVDYFPFGMEARTYTRTAADPTKYLYNAGAEKNDYTSYYETFYRNYDASIGRFGGVDVAVAKYASVTPYNYALNDPIGLNDPLGDDPDGGGFWDPSMGSLATMYLYAMMGYSVGDGYLANNSRTGVGSGNHWTDQVRSLEGNMAVMDASTLRDFYGITDEMGNFDHERASEVARNYARNNDDTEALIYSIGINGLSDLNGGIVEGTENYIAYVDRFESTGEFIRSYNIGTDELGRFMYFLGLGSQGIYDLRIMAHESATALVENAAARQQAASNKGLEKAYNKSVKARLNARIVFRGVAYVGIAIDAVSGIYDLSKGSTQDGVKSIGMAGLGALAMYHPVALALYGAVLLADAMDCPQCSSSKTDLRYIESDNTRVHNQFKLPNN